MTDLLSPFGLQISATDLLSPCCQKNGRISPIEFVKPLRRNTVDDGFVKPFRITDFSDGFVKPFQQILVIEIVNPLRQKIFVVLQVWFLRCGLFLQ